MRTGIRTVEHTIEHTTNLGIDAALEPLADALLADGYALRADRLGDRFARVELAATPDACAECLVPADVFGAIVRTRLGEVLGGAWDVDVVYPS